MGNPWAPPDTSSSPSGPEHPQRPPQAPDARQQDPQHPDPQQQDAQQPPLGTEHPGHVAPQHQPPFVPAPSGPPAAPPPDPVGVARSSRAAAWSAASLLGSLLLVSAPWPGVLLAPAVALTGLVLAVVAAVRAGRARGRGAVVALPVVLVVASLGWLAFSGSLLVFADVVRANQQCQSAALTQQARRECVEQLEVDTNERLTSLLERAGGRAPANG